MSKWNKLKSKMEKMHGDISKAIKFQEGCGQHPAHLKAKKSLLWLLLREMEELEKKELEDVD